jgi:hypothetical protein
MHTHQRSSDPVANIGLDVGMPCRHFVQMLGSRIGTLYPSTAAQQSRQLWEGKADPQLNAAGGPDTPEQTSAASARCSTAIWLVSNTSSVEICGSVGWPAYRDGERGAGLWLLSETPRRENTGFRVMFGAAEFGANLRTLSSNTGRCFRQVARAQAHWWS